MKTTVRVLLEAACTSVHARVSNHAQVTLGPREEVMHLKEYKVTLVTNCGDCPYMQSFAHKRTGKEKHFCTHQKFYDEVSAGDREMPPEIHDADNTRVPSFCPLRENSMTLELVPDVKA